MKKGRREQILRTNYSTRVCGATVKVWRFSCNHQLKYKLPFSKEAKSVLKTLELQCKSWTDSVLIENYSITVILWKSGDILSRILCRIMRIDLD